VQKYVVLKKIVMNHKQSVQFPYLRKLRVKLASIIKRIQKIEPASCKLQKQQTENGDVHLSESAIAVVAATYTADC
jgi:septum formation topological specificity factor MinE